MSVRRSAVVSFLLLAAAGAAYSLLTGTAHEFSEGRCAECHAVKPEKGKPATLRMTAPIRDLCGRCHGAYLENAQTHPVELAPTAALPPADFPLSWEGKLTCSTCHDIHAGPSKRSLRRGLSGPEFCSVCHSSELASSSKSHLRKVGAAHMKYFPEAKGEKIDRVSRACLSCHDGSVASTADVQIPAGKWRHGSSLSRFDPQGSHPIGVRYRTALMKRGGLKPLAGLPPAIKLIEGKVGCPSCHDPFSKEPFHLVMSNAGARLCLECHDK